MAWCPIVTAMPSTANSSSKGEAEASEPETWSPQTFRMRARPLMPIPPTPTKCTFAGEGGSNGACGVWLPELIDLWPLMSVHDGCFGLRQRQRGDCFTEPLAAIELIAKEPERCTAGREQNDGAGCRRGLRVH